ncbi:MAG: hypothetical protein ACE5DX_06215 [Candidatus Dojkabacteria bacterium]
MFSILGFSGTNIRNRLHLSGSKKWGWLHKEYFLSLFSDDKARRRIANEPRNVAIYLVRRYTGATLENIGQRV